MLGRQYSPLAVIFLPSRVCFEVLWEAVTHDQINNNLSNNYPVGTVGLDGLWRRWRYTIYLSNRRT